jgi:hypothetical protein
MMIKLSLLHGTFSFVRNMPENSLLFENEATGQRVLLSKFELPKLLSSGEAKLIEPVTDRWHYWGRPEVLITDDERGLARID